MVRNYIVLAACLLSASLKAQQQVSFYAEDSLRITADLYLENEKAPFVLLFHQGDASRGEYLEIAPRLLKLGYNCLAVDLRYGGKMNYIQNETSRLAQEGKYERSMLSAGKDIQAAIKFVQRYTRDKIILCGSSYSASLCLLEAAGNKNIKAVIAMSPGEYFRPDITIREEIKGITQPVFISSTILEESFVREMFSMVVPTNLYFFKPIEGRGEHGAKMLWGSGESSDQCWLELLLFFKKIRY